jgi:hypothetical protein
VTQPRYMDADGNAFTTCQCGCRRPLQPDQIGNAMYLSGAHAQRAYRKRVKAEAKAAGLEVAPSLRAVRAMGSPRGHNGDPQTGANGRRRARSGLQVSYRKAVEAAADVLVTFGVSSWAAPVAAENAMRTALSPAQRERLEARR